MRAETWGMLSAVVVAASAFPYAWNTLTDKAKPNITSWALWSIIGLALFLTYRDSGAGSNIWPAVFGFINPIIITAIAVVRRNAREPMTFWEKLSAVGCVASLGLWLAVHDSKDMAQFALYLAIIADLCAAIPTFIFVWKNPHEDRPGPWFLFAIGYSLGILAITDHTFANYVLPVYMGLGALSIAWILAAYRVERHIPIRQWL